ncbi:unnamed protein product [Chrysodeixis includens]|uniref:Microsomal glutathione S-transferase 1 n=1 Tax=Chrysodeixis includens TaxID=689277 RepID=A0A9N8KXT3_CHRIL|nr:unnamed protein product [Chrysodeixis includens]
MVSIDLADPVVQSYLFYSSVLALKMFLVALLTSKTRIQRNVFANQEDATVSKGKVKFDDPEIERVRRAHLNDLENIPAFWVLGALYLTTGPSAFVATTLFRVFTAFRILHTLVYAVKPLPQPSRFIAFVIPMIINNYMGLRVFLTYVGAY